MENQERIFFLDDKEYKLSVEYNMLKRKETETN